MQQNLPLGRDISRFIIVRYNVAVFLVFLLRKYQFVPSPRVTSILVHISPLSAARNNGAITATGPRHRPHGFLSTPAGVTAIFTKAARTMASCSARLLDVRHLRRTLPINREAITFCMHRG